MRPVELLLHLAGFAVLTYLAYKHVREFIEIRQCRRRQRLAEWQRRSGGTPEI